MASECVRSTIPQHEIFASIIGDIHASEEFQGFFFKSDFKKVNKSTVSKNTKLSVCGCNTNVVIVLTLEVGKAQL